MFTRQAVAARYAASNERKGSYFSCGFGQNEAVLHPQHEPFGAVSQHVARPSPFGSSQYTPLGLADGDSSNESLTISGSSTVSAAQAVRSMDDTITKRFAFSQFIFVSLSESMAPVILFGHERIAVRERTTDRHLLGLQGLHLCFGVDINRMTTVDIAPVHGAPAATTHGDIAGAVASQR